MSSEAEERDLNVKNVLAEMKDISEEMLDLAYSAVLCRNSEVVEEVLRLEERMDALLYNLRVAAMLGARSVQDAIELAGIMQIASAAEKISNAAGDIAKTAVSVDLTCYFDLEDLEEGVVNVRVAPNSALCGKTLGELKLETATGMRVLAIKRGQRWIYSPRKDERLEANDILIASGPTESIPAFYKLASCKEFLAERRSRRQIFEEITDKIAEMKNISELMVGLAYSSVRFQSKEIAEEVAALEERMDAMKDDLEMLVLEAAASVRDKRRFSELRAILHVAFSSEIVADAAYEIADTVLREIRMHPVFTASLQESDEVVLKVTVLNEAVFGKTLEEVSLETKTGMFVLAIRTAGGNWIYNPDEKTVLRAGDTLILRGPREGEEEVRRILAGSLTDNDTTKVNKIGN